MRRSLTKADRIKEKSDVRRVFSSKTRIQCSGARLNVVGNGLDRTRFMVSMVRRYGNSVERNKAKRVCREIFRNTRYLIKPGYDLVFILYPGAYGFHERSSQFRRLCSRADLFL